MCSDYLAEVHKYKVNKGMFRDFHDWSKDAACVTSWMVSRCIMEATCDTYACRVKRVKSQTLALRFSAVEKIEEDYRQKLDK